MHTVVVAWTVDELKYLEAMRHRLAAASGEVPAGNLEWASRVSHTWHSLADRLIAAGVYLAPSSYTERKCQHMTPEYSKATLEARIAGLL